MLPRSSSIVRKCVLFLGSRIIISENTSCFCPVFFRLQLKCDIYYQNSQSLEYEDNEYFCFLTKELSYLFDVVLSAHLHEMTNLFP